jgi:chromosomal replication initiator protein
MNSWEKILQHMERRVNPHSFATWFLPTKQEGTDNGTVVVRVPSRPFRKRLTETYGELLQAVLVEVGMPDVQLNFVCSEPEPVPAATSPIKQTRLDFDAPDHQLNLRYTFDTFVVGGSNQFAHAAARAVAEAPSKAYNPL